MSRPKLSVCMIARDEEGWLHSALRSVEGVADEIVVCIDDRTRDRTAQIARECGARVSRFVWQDSFAEARNRSLEHARHPWIFVIDADDRLTLLGQSIIRETLRRHRRDIQGYAFEIEERKTNGQRMRTEFSSTRLFPNHPDYRYAGRVHEQVMRRGKPLDVVARISGIAICHSA